MLEWACNGGTPVKGILSGTGARVEVWNLAALQLGSMTSGTVHGT